MLLLQKIPSLHERYLVEKVAGFPVVLVCPSSILPLYNLYSFLIPKYVSKKLNVSDSQESIIEH